MHHVRTLLGVFVATLAYLLCTVAYAQHTQQKQGGSPPSAARQAPPSHAPAQHAPPPAAHTAPPVVRTPPPVVHSAPPPVVHTAPSGTKAPAAVTPQVHTAPPVIHGPSAPPQKAPVFVDPKHKGPAQSGPTIASPPRIPQGAPHGGIAHRPIPRIPTAPVNAGRHRGLGIGQSLAIGAGIVAVGALVAHQVHASHRPLVERQVTQPNMKHLVLHERTWARPQHQHYSAETYRRNHRHHWHQRWVKIWYGEWWWSIPADEDISARLFVYLDDGDWDGFESYLAELQEDDLIADGRVYADPEMDISCACEQLN